VKEERLRASIVDYVIIEALAATRRGGQRFLCEAPARLHLTDPVVVTELAIDATGWQQLSDQLSRLAAVRDRALLNLIEVGPDLDPLGSGVFLASESAPGGCLADPVQAIDVAGLIEAAANVARAAHALHEAGIAHGAIDAQTIQLTERGAVLGPPPLDAPAGMATRISDWRDVVTMDPDLLRGEAPSRSTDIWSLGATLHGVLSTRPLYPGMDSDEPVTAVQRILFTRPEVDPSIPRPVAETIAACLDPDPGARPSTAEEVADRLLAAKAEL
jgi:serine/threonine protein kinase